MFLQNSYNYFVIARKYQKGIASVMVLALLALLGTGGVVVASDNAVPGDALYTVDQATERVRLALAASPEAKARLEANLAQERLEEAVTLTQRNQERNIERALERYQEHIKNAQQNTQQAKENGKDVDEIVDKLTENYLRHQEVLADVYEKVPDNAKGAIEKAIENSMKGYDQAVESVSKEKQNEYTEMYQERVEDVKTRMQQRGILQE
jgi:hypothetical protein